MCVVNSDDGLRPGLTLDEIEARLVASAHHHHLEERNIAYWLYEVSRRSLYEKRGFSSIGDYAQELIEIQPRKAQYLVFIASRLERLPRIGEAFDAGKISWTKAREIVRVATPETEEEWLERAKTLSSRDLEKEVRRREGRGSGEFATLTISLPIELLSMWNDCYELAERLSAADIEKWQVLEPMMAEFLSTYLAAEHEEGPSHHESEEEKELSASVRHEVLERDGYRCTVPGCTMRKMLDVHHLTFRSQGGGHELTNLTTICRIHHALIHRAICTLTGTAPEGLKFERPQLFTERKPAFVAPAPIPEPPVETPLEESEDWREETVAAIFDTPPEPKPPREGLVRRDPFREWIEYQLERGREDRAHARRRALERLRRAGPRREHVFVEPDFTSGGLEWGDSRTTPPDPAAARDSTRDG